MAFQASYWVHGGLVLMSRWFISCLVQGQGLSVKGGSRIGVACMVCVRIFWCHGGAVHGSWVVGWLDFSGPLGSLTGHFRVWMAGPRRWCVGLYILEPCVLVSLGINVQEFSSGHPCVLREIWDLVYVFNGLFRSCLVMV